VKEILLQSNKGGLRAHIYFSDIEFNDIEKIYVCAPGMPSFLKKDFFENLLSKNKKLGFAVVYYYGYWFSSGDFSIKNCADSLSDFVFYLRKGSFVDTFFDKKVNKFEGRISLIGYSFGANPLLRALDKIEVKDVEDIILVAPLPIIHNLQINDGSKEIADFYSFNIEFAKFISNGYAELIRDKTGHELKDYFSGIHENSIVQPIDNFIDKIKLFYGNQDKMIPKIIIDQFVDKINIKNIKTIDGIGHSKYLIETAIKEITRQ